MRTLPRYLDLSQALARDLRISGFRPLDRWSEDLAHLYGGEDSARALHSLVTSGRAMLDRVRGILVLRPGRVKA